MRSFLALVWRLLLAFALVANPLAAAAMPCQDEAAATIVASESLPCHEQEEAAVGSEASEPTAAHDCAGCDFASCCANGLAASVDTSTAPAMPAHDIGHAPGARAQAAPLLPPLIRPPIA